MEVTIPVSQGQVKGDATVTLTRAQLEAALKEINKPERKLTPGKQIRWKGACAIYRVVTFIGLGLPEDRVAVIAENDNGTVYIEDREATLRNTEDVE